MPEVIAQLPPSLENAEKLIDRRVKAQKRKALWRSLYKDCYRYAMPQRETFDEHTEGEFKNTMLYDSTLQEATYNAANTMVATLFPPWQRWGALAPGIDIDMNALSEDQKANIRRGIQFSVQTFFDYLDQSNFAAVSSEAALDLQVGTAALRFDEGKSDAEPFDFSATPLSAIELEEGPDGSIKTVFMYRKPMARNLVHMYPGMEKIDLPLSLRECIEEKPDERVELVQATVYEPVSKNTYGVVIALKEKAIIWRVNYGPSSPDIVARASKIAGELYGRGRVMLALADARTLDKMQEFVLRHLALQIAPPMTGVSDGVLNPYTAVLRPNTILPVASNDNRNPSLRRMETGENFVIGDTIMEKLRERIRRTLMGPEPAEGPVKSATEISINDRNRLWALGGEYGRIQQELLVPVMARGIYILQERGIIPRFRVDGREVKMTFTSPFARSQDAEDLMALDRAVASLASFEGAAQIGYKMEDIPAWVGHKTGLDENLIRSKTEVEIEQKKAADAAVQLAQASQNGELPTG